MAAGVVCVAVFDLDGTIIDGESPLTLTMTLIRRRTLPIYKGLAMGWWGLRYRLRLPQTESTPRELLFSCLTEPTVEEVDEEIYGVYDSKIRKRIRPGAIEEIERCRAQGMKVLLASASFKPITTTIVEELELDGMVCTVMEERDGHYTGRVLGEPVQGAEKPRRIIEFCNEAYGEGNWVIERAYSDHFSDIPLLEAAQHAIVTDPDGLLERTANKRGWPIVDWDAPKN